MEQIRAGGEKINQLHAQGVIKEGKRVGGKIVDNCRCNWGKVMTRS